MIGVVLKVFATNGVDFSPIITETYQTDILDKTIVDVAHRTARAFEHLNAEILDIMSTVLDEKGINTPDTIATLIKT